MDIGGNDIVFNIAPTPALKDFILRYVKGVWPKMQVEKVPDVDEWFFYKDRVAMKSWDDWGCIDENDDTMVHLLYGDDRFTMVVAGSDGSKTGQMAIELRQNIKVNFHTFGILRD